jgi:oligopeptide transport system permease protein
LIYYILRRLLYSFLSLFIIITITFFMMHAIPGNVFTGEKKLTPTMENNLKAKYGLDKPLYQQYLISLENIVTLDFGMSMKNEGRNVNDIISSGFPVSARLGLFSIAICFLIGIPLGVISALKAGKWPDQTSMVIATIGVSVPSFVVATLSQYFFGVKLKMLPVMGFRDITYTILPAFALSFMPMSFIARMIRSNMSETMEQDFIRTARAKGLSEFVVVYKHALKNSIMPVITYMGPFVAYLLTGSFIIEKIFAIPGLGRYFVDSISDRDYTVMMGVVVFYAIFLIFMNFLVDIIYVVIDPRIKLKD